MLTNQKGKTLSMLVVDAELEKELVGCSESRRMQGGLQLGLDNGIGAIEMTLNTSRDNIMRGKCTPQAL